MNEIARTVLVTGAGGALGRSVVTALNSDETIRPIPWTRSADGDITDFARVDTALSLMRPDAVVHLAGITGSVCDRDPEGTRRTNVEATMRLARAAAHAGAQRLVFASSAAVYGDSGTSPFRESDDLAGTSVYGRSKIEAEAALADVAARTNLEIVALRIFNIYGDDFPSSLITRISRASADCPVVLKGADGFVRDYIHSDDVAQAVRRGLTIPLEQVWSVFNIASGKATSNADLWAMLTEESRLHVRVEPGTASYSVADTSLCAARLGIDVRPLESYF